MQHSSKSLSVVIAAMLTFAGAFAADLATVVAKPFSRDVELPGELQPFESVEIHAKIRGYVERVLVDRGSIVKQGQLLVELSAPEMKAQIAEAQSKVQAAEAGRLQAQAQLTATKATFERLKKASETPGAIAGNELIQAEQQVQAAQALVESRQQASQAAQAAARAEKDLQGYLRITAPFDGIITDRLVHPGALAGPGSDPALLVIQQIAHLRLVVAVPEENTGAIVRGARVGFHVPAYPDRVYTGTVARISHNVDRATRSMPVELDVINRDRSLSPGMYTSVRWPVRRAQPVLLAPKTSVVTTTERTFVIRDVNGRARWVDVRKGVADGDAVVVSGNLHAGDRVVRLASDEIRDGEPLR